MPSEGSVRLYIFVEEDQVHYLFVVSREELRGCILLVSRRESS
jgi:hypothetical protein